ncbi:LysR family transcriptional regulator [Sphingomonas sp.]|uniref:LysR family transcriptional regulator n=1 Tax=Sphingomonas sp. TaxID=28214 RepID=UPI0025D06F88|nr:LysR family transcriptional regulator [Sphingomonas sp.]
MPYDGRLIAGATVLMAVVEAGSIARAAAALGLSPSGASRALQRLEARIGVRLVDRTTRALSLTDEGRRFYDQAGPLIEGIEEAALDVAGAVSAVRGRLRVNIDAFFSRAVLAARLPDFLARHPDLGVELVMRDRTGDLIADGFDLAIRFGDPPAGRLVARKLTETRVLTVAAPSYLAVHGVPRHPADLAHHACIDFYDAASGRPYPWEFRRGNEVLPVTPPARLMVSDSGTMAGVCVAGAGIAQFLELGTEDLIASGQVVPVLTDWSDELFPLYALMPSRHQRAARVRAFVDFVIEAIAARRA